MRGRMLPILLLCKRRRNGVNMGPSMVTEAIPLNRNIIKLDNRKAAIQNTIRDLNAGISKPARGLSGLGDTMIDAAKPPRRTRQLITNTND
jgi:hypothetical protein